MADPWASIPAPPTAAGSDNTADWEPTAGESVRAWGAGVVSGSSHNLAGGAIQKARQYGAEAMDAFGPVLQGGRYSAFGAPPPNISKADAMAEAKAQGVELHSGIGEDGISPGGLRELIRDHKEDQRREALMSAAELNGWGTGSAYIVGGIADPTILIPFTGSARAATFLGRVATIVAKNAAVAAPSVAAQATMEHSRGYDYTLEDGMREMAWMTGLGSLAGVGADVLSRLGRKKAALAQVVAGQDAHVIPDQPGNVRLPSAEEWDAVARDLQQAAFRDLDRAEVAEKIRATLGAENVPRFTPAEWQQTISDILQDAAFAKAADFDPRLGTSITAPRSDLARRPLEGGPPPRTQAEVLDRGTAIMETYFEAKKAVEADYHALRINQPTREARLEALKTKMSADMKQAAKGLAPGDVDDEAFKEAARKIREAHPKLVRAAELDEFRVTLKEAIAHDRAAQKAERTPSPGDLEKLRAYQREALGLALETAVERATPRRPPAARPRPLAPAMADAERALDEFQEPPAGKEAPIDEAEAKALAAERGHADPTILPEEADLLNWPKVLAAAMDCARRNGGPE